MQLRKCFKQSEFFSVSVALYRSVLSDWIVLAAKYGNIKLWHGHKSALTWGFPKKMQRWAVSVLQRFRCCVTWMG